MSNVIRPRWHHGTTQCPYCLGSIGLPLPWAGSYYLHLGLSHRFRMLGRQSLPLGQLGLRHQLASSLCHVALCSLLSRHCSCLGCTGALRLCRDIWETELNVLGACVLSGVHPHTCTSKALQACTAFRLGSASRAIFRALHYTASVLTIDGLWASTCFVCA